MGNVKTPLGSFEVRDLEENSTISVHFEPLMAEQLASQARKEGAREHGRCTRTSS